MKLLLISLQSNTYITGLKYIAANARAHGHDVRILLLPGYLDDSLHLSIEDFIREFSPDLIGMGLMSIEFYPAKNVTLLIREKFDIPIIWGGVHAIIKPDECLKYADYVCTGEGEHAVVSLLEGIGSSFNDKIHQVPGIVSRNVNEAEAGNSCVMEPNLDRLPYQEYLPGYFYGFHKGGIYNFAENQGLFRKYSLYGGSCHMTVTTRGCPYSCSYCGNSYFKSVFGRKVRERSVHNVISELRDVKKNPHVLYINVQDDCFFAHSKDWIRKFCEEYKKHINIPFLVRVIPTMINRAKLMMLVDAGLSWIVMGIQSGSDRVNYEVFDRRVKFSAVKKAADMIAETRLAPFYEMIVDNPYEDENEQLQTVRAISTLQKPFTISLAHLTFFPGTPLAAKAVEDGFSTEDAYLFRYLVKIDRTYINRLLDVTPYLPAFVIRFFNRPAGSRSWYHKFLLNVIVPIIKRTVEPAVYFFITTRALNYNISWTVKTVRSGWRSAVSRVIFNFLGKGDLEYDDKLATAKRQRPALFEG